LIELVNKETDECQSLFGQIELEGIVSYSRKCLAEALEYAANNKYGEYIPICPRCSWLFVVTSVDIIYIYAKCMGMCCM